jgi:hypothetical protein
MTSRPWPLVPANVPRTDIAAEWVQAICITSVVAMASAAARLLRAYATQVEALRRLRNGGSQTLRVEHVHVNEGGQALIGNVNSIPGSGR